MSEDRGFRNALVSRFCKVRAYNARGWGYSDCDQDDDGDDDDGDEGDKDD